MTFSTMPAPESEQPKVWKRSSKNMDAEFRLSCKATQLESLSCMLYGDSGASFRTLNEQIQDCILWHLSEQLTVLRELVEQCEAEGRGKNAPTKQELMDETLARWSKMGKKKPKRRRRGSAGRTLDRRRAPSRQGA